MVCVDSVLIEEPEPECPALPMPDAEIPATVKKLHINQNLKKDKGSLAVTMTFPLDYVIELNDGESVQVKVQLIQDGKTIELTGDIFVNTCPFTHLCLLFSLLTSIFSKVSAG